MVAKVASCESFCTTYFLEHYRKYLEKQYKTNPFLKKDGRTEREIQQLVLKADKSKALKHCQENFCHASGYSCPICRKKSREIKKLGALSYCAFDNAVGR